MNERTDMPADEIANALSAGFSSPAYVTAAELAAARDGAPVTYARLLGQCLGERAQTVWSASISEYKADAAAYDQIATEINTRFGDGLAILTGEGGPLGIAQLEN